METARGLRAVDRLGRPGGARDWTSQARSGADPSLRGSGGDVGDVEVGGDGLAVWDEDAKSEDEASRLG